MSKIRREFRTEDLWNCITNIENAAYSEAYADSLNNMKGKRAAIKKSDAAYERLQQILNITR